MEADDGVTMRVSRLHFPVTALGPGMRVGIWTQGCTVGCAGCIARDTWAPNGGTAVPVAALVATCRAWLAQGATGVTISGGDPFEQPEPLELLLSGLRAAAADLPGEIDILCYSGRSEAWLRARHSRLLDLLDVLVPEPYRPQAGAGGAWRGSANQPLLLLSDLARRRYTLQAVADGAGRMQVTADDEGVWLIGVPRPGDLDRIDAELSARGVILGGASWRP